MKEAWILDTACVNVTYRDRDNAFEEICFASAPAQEICLRICAEKPFTVKISAENGFLTEQRYETDGFALFGRLPGQKSADGRLRQGRSRILCFFGNPGRDGNAL